MSMSNKNVIEAWKSGKKASNGRKSLSTDGTWLYSYRLKVGFRTTNGICVLGNYTSSGYYRSQTTSCHIGRAKRRISDDLLWHPAIFENSHSNFLLDIIPTTK